ncbi:hypothetical protein GCM10025786_24050 [Nocardioides caeni]
MVRLEDGLLSHGVLPLLRGGWPPGIGARRRARSYDGRMKKLLLVAVLGAAVAAIAKRLQAGGGDEVWISADDPA